MPDRQRRGNECSSRDSMLPAATSMHCTSGRSPGWHDREVSVRSPSRTLLCSGMSDCRIKEKDRCLPLRGQHRLILRFPVSRLTPQNEKPQRTTKCRHGRGRGCFCQIAIVRHRNFTHRALFELLNLANVIMKDLTPMLNERPDPMCAL